MNFVFPPVTQPAASVYTYMVLKGVVRFFVIYVKLPKILCSIQPNNLWYFFSSLAMMYAPQAVEPKYQVKAGMFAAAMLITGIFGGILFSFLNPYFIV